MKEYIVKVYSDRTEWYNKDGQLHREDGPAVECANGTKLYWLNGKRHREDGPAVECVNGDKSYWINGKRHREDGPAIEWVNGNKYYYLNGKKYSEEEFYKKINDKSCANKVVEIDGKKYQLKLIEE